MSKVTRLSRYRQSQRIKSTLFNVGKPVIFNKNRRTTKLKLGVEQLNLREVETKNIMELLEALFCALTNPINDSRITATEIRSKLLLTLDEAQIITRLSRERLIAAIKDGKLPSKMIDEIYRIKTKDLEQYITDLNFQTFNH
jgi:hypothetical protein